MNRVRAFAMIVLLALAGAAAARGQELSQAEKERAVKYLESTKKGVLEATKGLSDAQWNFKPAADRWSIAQVMEHIADEKRAFAAHALRSPVRWQSWIKL